MKLSVLAVSNVSWKPERAGKELRLTNARDYFKTIATFVRMIPDGIQQSIKTDIA